MTGQLDVRALRQPAVVLAAAAAFIFIFFQLNSRGLLVLLPALALGGLLALGLARYPLAGYGFLLMSVPFQRLGSEGTLLPVTLTQLVFPVALAGFFIHFVATRRPLRGHIVLLPYTALILVMVASALGAVSFTSSLAEIARWSVALVAFWLALQIVVGGSQRALIGVVALLAFGGVFESTVGVVQSLIGWGPFQIESGVSRAFGTFGRPNSFAGYLEMTLFPAIAMAYWCARETVARYRIYVIERARGLAASAAARRKLFRSAFMFLYFSGSAAVIMSGILASLSRGAWLGVGLGAIAVALLLGRFSRLLVVLGLLSLIGLLLGGQGTIVPENFRARITESASQLRPFDVRNVTITDENFAAAERVAHWQSGWDMYQDNPALGVGVGNYNVRFEDYSVREMFRTSQGHAHNYYIHTLAETGLVGLLAYLCLLGSVAALALRVLLSTRVEDEFARILVLGAFGSMVSIAVHNTFENLHVLNLGIIISLHWALVIAGHERWRSAATGPA